MPVRRMLPVVSENIDSLGYDPTSRRLRVRFNSGPTYEYEDVDPVTYCLLLNAQSVGEFFSVIRNDPEGYPCRKMKPTKST